MRERFGQLLIRMHHKNKTIELQLVCLHCLHFEFENVELDEKLLVFYVYSKQKHMDLLNVAHLPINLKRKPTNSIDTIG